MPHTQMGMDLNPVFTSPTAFRPGGSGGELKLFEQVGIKLVHGWLVDPASREAQALERTPDYDTAASLIAEVDHITNGRFVMDKSATAAALEEGQPSSAPSSSPSSPSANPNFSLEQQGKIQDAIVIRDFLEHTQSQLTYHGLFQLASTLEPGELVALFRNSHLSVLLKADESEQDASAALHTLVTDQVFMREPSVVWERLEDVDGGWSTFVDSDFVRASPAGGDFAGQTAEDALRAMEIAEEQCQAMGDPFDHALAKQLQAEEDYLARQEHEDYLRKHHRLNEMKHEPKKSEKSPKKKSKDCLIM